MWGRTRPGGTPPPNRNVDHWDRLINAYVDDMLSPAQRLEVEEFLSLHPEVSRRVADYRNQNRGLHELYDRYLSEPLPDAAQLLEQRLVAKLTRRSRFNALARATAAAAIVVLAVAGGWSGSRYYLAVTQGKGATGDVAARSEPTARVGALSAVRKAKVAASTLEAAAGPRAGGFPAPDLRSHGFMLTSSRDIGRPDGTGAERLVYETKSGLQMTLYVAATDDNGTRKITLSRRGPIWFLLWNHHGRAYSMIGEVDRDTMLAIGATINAQWGQPARPDQGPTGNAPLREQQGGLPPAGKVLELNEKTLIRPAASEEKAAPREPAP